MLPISLLSENLVQIDGTGPSVAINCATGKLLVLNLGITRILEQESLEVSVWGSVDGADWGLRPLASFPPKSYCGLYSILLNLSSQPGVRLVRVQWKMIPWRKSPLSRVMCEFYVDAEESGTRLRSRAAAEPDHTAAVA